MSQFYSAPGIYAGPSLASRNIFTNFQPGIDQFVPSGLFLDGTTSGDAGESPSYHVRAGVVLGLETSSGMLRPSIIGLNSGAITATATSITVNAAVATEVARLIAANGGAFNITITGPASTGATQTVNHDTVSCTAASGTTLTIAATTHAFVVGSYIQAADGSQAPLTVLADQYGLTVQDVFGNRMNQPINTYLRGADLLSAMIVNLTADDFGTTTEPACQAWLKAQLKAAGPFTFDNDR